MTLQTDDPHIKTILTVTLLSLFIFNGGNALLTTLVPLRLDIENTSTLMIGLANSAFFFGLAISAFRSEAFIIRVGHIRTFAIFASLSAVVTMLMGLFVSPSLWILFRLIGGICLGGLFIVVESWLLVACAPTNRGRVLSIYMIVFYTAQVLGQLLLTITPINTVLPFCIATILASLSVVPICFMKVDAPEFTQPSTLSFRQLFRLSQTGLIGSLVSGLVIGAAYGMLPLYFSEIGTATSEIALLIATFVFGGMILQYPLGYLSDKTDRLIVLMGSSFVAALIGALILFLPDNHRWLLFSSIFLFGGLVFPLYPISISYASDLVGPDDMVAVTQGFLFSYSIGATIGPLTAGVTMELVGTRGLFVLFSVATLAFALFIFSRKRKQPKARSEVQQDFVNVPQTSPVAMSLDPRAEFCGDCDETDPHTHESQKLV